VINNLNSAIFRSIFVLNSFGNDVEVGWMANNEGFSDPTVYAEWLNRGADSLPQPFTLQVLNENSYQGFYVDNVGHIDIFRFYVGGLRFDYSPTMIFNTGYTITNSEHYNQCDSLWTDMVRTRTRSLRGVTLVLASWILVAAFGLMIFYLTSSSHSVRADRLTSQNGGLVSQNGLSLTKPLMDAQKVTAGTAQAAVRFEVPMPDATIANIYNLTQTWTNKLLRQVAMVFDHGKVTIMMWPATYRSPRIEYQSYITENDVSAHLGVVHGLLALIITPHTDASHSNPAWVEFDDNGVDVNLVSANYGTRALLAVADNLRL
jgi:hypothetical protein